MDVDGRRLMLLLSALAVTALSSVHCAGPGTRADDMSGLPLREASDTELVALINSRADSIRGVKADVDLSFRKAAGEEVRGCRGKLVSVRSESGDAPSVYLKGYRRLLPTFFTFVSDGREFWLHVPSKDTVYTGPVGLGERHRAAGSDTLEVDLDAGDLGRALFVEPVDTSLTVDVKSSDEYYVLSVSDGGTLRRRLRVERRMFSVVDETFYDPEGAEELELARTDFSRDAGIPYALKTAIVKPGSGREITIEIRELDLNPDGVKPEVFEFEPPSGVRVERLN